MEYGEAACHLKSAILLYYTIVWCYVMWCDVTLCYTMMWCYIMWCYAVLHYDVMLCDVMLRCAATLSLMWCYAMRYDALLHCAWFKSITGKLCVRTHVRVHVRVMHLYLLSFLFFIFIDSLMWSNDVIICLNIMHVRPCLTTESHPWPSLVVVPANRVTRLLDSFGLLILRVFIVSCYSIWLHDFMTVCHCWGLG